MAERPPAVFLTVTTHNYAPVVRLFDDLGVPYTAVPMGTDEFRGWLRDLAPMTTSADLAILITAAPASGSLWTFSEHPELRQMASAVACRRMLFIDASRDEPAKVLADALEIVGETRLFRTQAELDAMLRDLLEPFAGKIPPPTPTPPRVLAAGARGSGIADVASADDNLGFEEYVQAVAGFLAHPQTAVPLTMSIEGPWGAGKSSFMLQLEKYLRGFKTIRFNAWRHEKAEELWAAFALHFVEKIKPEKRLDRWRADAALAWDRFDLASGWPKLLQVGFWFLALAAATITLGTMAFTLTPYELAALAGGDKTTLGQILGKWFAPLGGATGFFVAAGALVTLWKKFFGNVKSPLEIDLRKYLQRPDYEAKLSFIERFQDDMKKVVEHYLPDGRRVFVFIDDLDRCELPQAAELMRAINLMLGDTGPLVFVIGMDREKVAAALAVKNEKLLPFLSIDAPQPAAEAALADSLRGIFFGYEFIEKFIQIPFAVPEPSELNLDKFLQSLAPPKAAAATTAAASQAPAAPQPQAPAAPAGEQAPPTPPVPLHEFVRPLEEESANLLEIARRVAPALGNNPRRVKQFVNLFRLRVVIAFRTGVFVAPENTPPEQQITLEKIAKFIVIELRWPLLIAHAEIEPALLGILERMAGGEELPKELKSYRAVYWTRFAELMTLLRVGRDETASAADWTIGKLDLSKLTKVSVKKTPQAPAEHAAEPPNLVTALSEIDLLDSLGKHDEAVVRLVALEPFADREPLILQRLGYHLLWSDAKRALDYSRRYIAAQPSDPSGPFNAACGAAQLGQLDEAVKLLSDAIRGNPYYLQRARELVNDDFSPLASDPRFLALIGGGGSTAA